MLLLLACTGPDTAEPPPDRAVGDHTPLVTGCDPLDAARCWLPWPSFAATRVDDTSATGLRVEVADEELPNGDDPRWLELADGFSRLSPVLTAVDGEVDPATATIRLFDAGTGAEIPTWSEIVVDGVRTLIISYPSEVLPASAEIVAVVPDEVRLVGGGALTPERLDDVALGRVDAETDEELELLAWSAPIRATVDAAGVSAVRAWSFPTRSADDPGARARAMLAAVDEATLSVTITEVEQHWSPDVAAVVYGTIDGVPEFRPAPEEWINLDADGTPVAVGTHSALFRVVIPAGEGDWPVAMYGHGTGGDVTDGLFDDEIAARGLGKVGMQYHGWNGEELILSVTYFSHAFDASSRSTSALLQSVADNRAILLALQGPLADALAADTLGGAPNPAAGRRPIATNPIWVGGSLSGTMGAVIVAANPEIDTAVLSVPGAAWTHFIPQASLYSLLVDPITHAWYPSDIDRRSALAMMQNAWDDVDGAAWEDPDSVLLLQESMGDPVLPNVGTAMLAKSRGATLVGSPLDEMLVGLERADEVVGKTGITQFRTPFTDDLDIHGFAEEEGPVADAAREQIEVFLTSWLAGEPPRIIEPSACAEQGSCDFGP